MRGDEKYEKIDHGEESPRHRDEVEATKRWDERRVENHEDAGNDGARKHQGESSGKSEDECVLQPRLWDKANRSKPTSTTTIATAYHPPVNTDSRSFGAGFFAGSSVFAGLDTLFITDFGRVHRVAGVFAGRCGVSFFQTGIVAGFLRVGLRLAAIFFAVGADFANSTICGFYFFASNLCTRLAAVLTTIGADFAHAAVGVFDLFAGHIGLSTVLFAGGRIFASLHTLFITGSGGVRLATDSLALACIHAFLETSIVTIDSGIGLFAGSNALVFGPALFETTVDAVGAGIRLATILFAIGADFADSTVSSFDFLAGHFAVCFVTVLLAITCVFSCLHTLLVAGFAVITFVVGTVFFAIGADFADSAVSGFDFLAGHFAVCFVTILLAVTCVFSCLHTTGVTIAGGSFVTIFFAVGANLADGAISGFELFAFRFSITFVAVFFAGNGIFSSFDAAGVTLFGFVAFVIALAVACTLVFAATLFQATVETIVLVLALVGIADSFALACINAFFETTTVAFSGFVAFVGVADGFAFTCVVAFGLTVLEAIAVFVGGIGFGAECFAGRSILALFLAGLKAAFVYNCSAASARVCLCCFAGPIQTIRTPGKLRRHPTSSQPDQSQQQTQSSDKAHSTFSCTGEKQRKPSKTRSSFFKSNRLTRQPLIFIPLFQKKTRHLQNQTLTYQPTEYQRQRHGS